MQWLTLLGTAFLTWLRTLNAQANEANARAEVARQVAAEEHDQRLKEQAANDEVHGDVTDAAELDRLRNGRF